MLARNARIRSLLFIFAVIAVPSRCLGGPKVYVGRNVPVAKRVAIDQIDHSIWDGLLRRYVDQAGHVDYSAWQQSRSSQRALNDYLALLSSADPRRPSSREARFAFWINAYNALTIKGILREYPTTSIRNHTARLYGYNIWKDLLLTIGGDPFGLEQIEHDVLRTMGDSRIHYAIVCASISCPRLRDEAYVAAKLEAQLVDNAITFFSDSANFRHDVAGRRFHLSSVLKWFADDFGRDQAERLQTIAPYLPRSAVRAANTNSVRISYLRYDWGLNDQATAQ